MRLKVGLLSGWLVSSLFLTLKAAEVPDGPHVVTTGMATLEAQPDMAILQIEVSSVNKEAAKAKKGVDGRMADYFTFLQRQGIGEGEIDAANIQLYPEYDYKPVQQLKGYRAQRAVRVKVMQLDKLNMLLDGALQAGLNEIRAVEFSLAKPEKAAAEVRERAMVDAKRQAHLLAEGFGVKLGPIYRIRYQKQDQPVAYRAQAMAPASDAASVEETYQQKSITISDQIEVVFELQR